MELTHINEEGRAKMVDVSEKSDTAREAIAIGSVSMKRETLESDMCKAIDREMVINNIMLVKKSGGKSGTFERTGL